MEDMFCGYCGKEANPSEAKHQDVFVLLQPVLLYYFITLLLLGTYKFTEFFPTGLDGLLWISLLDIIVVIAFWIYSGNELNPIWSLKGVKWYLIIATIVGAIIGSFVVTIVANLINISINDDVFYNTYLFEDTPYPLLFSILFIAVQPAIFEEVVFRGFLFNGIKKVTNASGAIYTSAFLFGIMHLQIISLLWLIPLGLVFALMRNKYNTLWYGIVGHFTYNLCITLDEFMHWY